MGYEQNDETKKLIVSTIGSSKVGKTTIAKSLIGCNSEDIEKPTSLDVFEKKAKLHGTKVNIKINDIKSDDIYAADQMALIEKSDVLLIVFSRDNHGTFKHAINLYNKVRNLQNLLIAFVGTKFPKNTNRFRYTRNKWQLEQEFKDHYESLYFEFSDCSRGALILEKLFEEVEIKRGPYYTTLISMNQIRVKDTHEGYIL